MSDTTSTLSKTECLKSFSIIFKCKHIIFKYCPVVALGCNVLSIYFYIKIIIISTLGQTKTIILCIMRILYTKKKKKTEYIIIGRYIKYIVCNSKGIGKKL